MGLIILLLVPAIACDEESMNEVDPGRGYEYVVDAAGSGDFVSVQAALDAVKFLQTERIYILVLEGTYKEVIDLEEKKNNVALIGKGNVVLTYDNFASKVNPETGENYGTSGSSSTYIHGDDFYAYNITFENSSGPVGQALTVYIDGDRAVFENCRFLGYQDTMYNGRSRQFFKQCYIEGSTDFIFGPGSVFFDECDLYTKGGSAITASSTESYVDFGYIFSNCKITGSGENITTLGRPWRPFASVTFLNTEMSNCIRPEGWDNWGKEENEATARYNEYQSSGPGGSPSERVMWSNQLSPAEALQYTPENVFNNKYQDPPIPDPWDPEAEISAIKNSIEL